LEESNIKYLHTSELGVPKDKCDKLDIDEDYEKLWKWYDENILLEKTTLENLMKLFETTDGYPSALCVWNLIQ
jgi:uncharacterized protein (DUF488 family)